MNFKYLAVALAAVFTLAAPPAAKAEPDIRMYREAQTDEVRKELIELYLIGVAGGLKWTTAVAEFLGQDPIYCPPPELALTDDQILSIVDRYIEQKHPEDTRPLGLVVVLAFGEVFSCTAVAGS